MLLKRKRDEKVKLNIPRPKLKPKKKRDEDEESKTLDRSRARKRGHSLIRDSKTMKSGILAQTKMDRSVSLARESSATKRDTRKEKFLQRMKTAGLQNPASANGKKPFTINTYYSRSEVDTLQVVMQANGWGEAFHSTLEGHMMWFGLAL